MISLGSDLGSWAAERPLAHGQLQSEQDIALQNELERQKTESYESLSLWCSPLMACRRLLALPLLHRLEASWLILLRDACPP